jgi:hypothetical protein
MEDEVHLLLVDTFVHAPPEVGRVRDVLLPVINFQVEIDVAPAHIVSDTAPEQA